MWTSALFGAKTLDFSKFMVCPFEQRRSSHCGHFSDKGGGVQFLDFVRTSFMDSP